MGSEALGGLVFVALITGIAFVVVGVISQGKRRQGALQIAGLFLVLFVGLGFFGPILLENLAVRRARVTDRTIIRQGDYKIAFGSDGRRVSIERPGEKGGKPVKLTLRTALPHLADDNLDPSRPAAMVLRASGHKWLALTLVCSDSGPAMKRQVVLVRDDGRALSPVDDGRSLQFSEPGSWHQEGDTLYCWNGGHTGLGPGAARRYTLDAYRLTKQGGLTRLKRRETKKLYGMDWLNQSLDEPSKDEDPLREFGMVWRWWGDSRSLSP